MPLRAVIFDLDGTLLDSLTDIAASMNSVLHELGFPTHPVDAYRFFTGDGIAALVENTLPPGRRDPETVRRSIEAMKREYGCRWADHTRPFEGIPGLLDALTRKKIALNVLSNKLDEFTRKAVVRLLPGWDFVHVIGLRPGLPRKPDPAGALLIARSLKISPSEVLLLGDTDTDMMTARAAGMVAVGVLWGFRTRKELVGSGAEAVIDRPDELLAFFSD